MKKLIRNVLTSSALLIGSACSNLEFNKGFNAAYVGVNNKQEEGYTRVFTNANVSNNTARLHVHGLNELSGTNTDTYFGRNSVSVEPLNSGIEAIIEARGGSSGLFDGQPQYGLRDSHIPKILGADYGFFQATTNGSDGNLTMFYGKNLGFIANSLKPLSLEAFNSFDYRNGSKDSNLTELTADWSLSNNLSLFVRQDTNDLKFDDSNYVFGGVLKF
jgi:hypothetical protein